MATLSLLSFAVGNIDDEAMITGSVSIILLVNAFMILHIIKNVVVKMLENRRAVKMFNLKNGDLNQSLLASEDSKAIDNHLQPGEVEL